MRQKEGLIISIVEDGYVMVDANEENVKVHGQVHINSTTARIMDLLRKDLTFDELIDELVKTYDADRQTIEADVRKTVDKLIKIGFIIE